MLNFDTYTKDPDLVKKLLIGSLLALSGIGLIPLTGWLVATLRKNIQEEAPFLPDWDDFGQYVIDGLKGLGIGFIWALPVSVLVTAGAFGGVALATTVPDEDTATLVILITNICIFAIMIPYTLILGALSGPALGRLAETGSFRDALSPSAAYRVLRANFGGFLIAYLISAIGQSVLGSIGALLCLIGIYPATVLAYGLMGQQFGQAYRQAKANLPAV